MRARSDRPRPFLGGLSSSDFMRHYWQRQPLLVRAAYRPDWISVDELKALAARDDAEVRLVSAFGGRWQARFGPQAALPRRRRDWTILVQGINRSHAGAHALLQSVDFLPSWRLDDVMVSYAVPGGGVGPHCDSYDVFLLQVSGHRRWRISRHADPQCIAGLPLKVLAHFSPEQQWDLGPGDLLYLPPEYAHEGVALDHCLTASIGFRAPSYGELSEGFLHYLAEQRVVPGRYADRGSPPTAHPGELSSDLIDAASTRLLAMAPRRADVIEFLGQYLSEPKPTVYFEVPKRPPTSRQLERRKQGVALDARSILIYRGRSFFINGERLTASGAERRLLTRLADRRSLNGCELSLASAALKNQLDAWLADGWLVGGIGE